MFTNFIIHFDVEPVLAVPPVIDAVKPTEEVTGNLNLQYHRTKFGKILCQSHQKW